METSIPETEPALTCGILQVWIISRQFPDSKDYWDGNWLNIIAQCSDEGATVIIRGSFIHLRDIATWRSHLIKMNKSLKGSAELAPLEPNLYLKLECNNLGHIAVDCQITPDHMTQRHSFEFGSDQTFLKHYIKQCDDILKQYPIRNIKNQ